MNDRVPDIPAPDNLIVACPLRQNLENTNKSRPPAHYGEITRPQKIGGCHRRPPVLFHPLLRPAHDHIAIGTKCLLTELGPPPLVLGVRPLAEALRLEAPENLMEHDIVTKAIGRDALAPADTDRLEKSPRRAAHEGHDLVKRGARSVTR